MARLAWVESDIPELVESTVLRCLAYHEDATQEPDPARLQKDGWSRTLAVIREALQHHFHRISR